MGDSEQGVHQFHAIGHCRLGQYKADKALEGLSLIHICFKKGAYADNIRNFLKLYDEISEYLKSDTELVNIFQSQLTDACYSDPELKTLTIDVGFYISRYYSKKDAVVDTTTGWYGVDYDPGLSVDDWEDVYKRQP